MPRKPAYCPALIIILPFIFGSCATMLNGPTQTIRITRDSSIRSIAVEKCLRVDSSRRNGALLYTVARSRSPLVIHLATDTGQQAVLLRSHTSFAFWLNIYFNYGIGMLVDMDNPKRYSYPAFRSFGAAGRIVHHRRFDPIDKGIFRFSAALSFLNDIDVDCPERQYQSGGLFGLEVGADYFYGKNRYVSFSAGTGTNRLPVEYLGSGSITTKNAFYLNARNNHVAGRFDLGYGLSFSRLRWQKTYHGRNPGTDSTATNNGLGLSFSADYRLGDYWRLGVLYQPGTWSSGLPGDFSYQHYFTLRFLWRLPFNRKQ